MAAFGRNQTNVEYRISKTPKSRPLPGYRLFPPFIIRHSVFDIRRSLRAPAPSEGDDEDERREEPQDPGPDSEGDAVACSQVLRTRWSRMGADRLVSDL